MEFTTRGTDGVWVSARSRRSRFAIAAACSAACLLAISTASAQRYQSDPVDEQARRLSGFMPTWLRDPGRYSSEKDRFTEYFEKAYFPSMTQYGAKDLEDLGEKRYDLFNDILWKTNNAELQRHLTDLAKDYMIKIVRGRYHPAVRYNAILVLGMLDQDYGDDRANRPPTPLPDANTSLVALLNSAAQATAQDRAVPAYLVVGALIGLERHARFRDSLEAQQREAVTTAVRALLANDPPLIDLDRDVAEWIQLRAATVLARLGSPGANGEVHQTLLSLLAGQDGRKMTLDSRCQLVALLALVNYEGASVDAKATADQVFQLAIDVAQAEAKRAKEFEDMHLGGGMMGGGRRSGRRRFQNFGEQLEFDRRVLLSRLGDLRTGLRAAKPLLPADRQAAVDAMLAAIKKATDAAEDNNMIDLDVSRDVRAMAREIEKAANPGAPPAEDEMPADAF